MTFNTSLGRFSILILGLLLSSLLSQKISAADLPSTGNSGKNIRTFVELPLPEKAVADGALKGFVQTEDGIPLAGGDVFFFNAVSGPFPKPEKYWRVPEWRVNLDDKGGFLVELPSGRYYLGAIQRKGGQKLIGPPAVGDLFYAGNTAHEVLPAAQNNLDVIRGAKPFSIDNTADNDGITAIEGSVFDYTGKPLANAVVFAHIKAEMNDRPLFVSSRTGNNGGYQLRLAGSGTYYLRVRDIYGGGMPVAGSMMGVYGGDRPKGVAIKKGEVIKNVNLTAVEFAKPLRKENDIKK